jgi:hypothetical protein
MPQRKMKNTHSLEEEERLRMEVSVSKNDMRRRW